VQLLTEGTTWQVQPDRQSPSLAQTVATTTHADVPVPVQVQSGGVWSLAGGVGVGGGVVVPPPTAPPPEQPHDCCSSQVKPGPQSAATWQGSCQRSAHWWTVVVVQVLDVFAGVLSVAGRQSVLGGHAGVAGVAGHCVDSNAAHSMSAPQSASVSQAAGAQAYESCGVQGGQLCPSRQAMSGHAPGTTWQVNPRGQVVSPQATCAEARPATATVSVPSASARSTDRGTPNVAAANGCRDDPRCMVFLLRWKVNERVTTRRARPANQRPSIPHATPKGPPSAAFAPPGIRFPRAASKVLRAGSTQATTRL